MMTIVIIFGGSKSFRQPGVLSDIGSWELQSGQIAVTAGLAQNQARLLGSQPGVREESLEVNSETIFRKTVFHLS